MGELIDYQIAIDRRRNKRGSWKHARERLLEEVWPVITPSFELPPGGKIFTIGSCFARNIEEHLQRLGFEIPMLKFQVPAEEWGARANGILNKYTPPAIFQEIEWTRKIMVRDGVVRESDCQDFRFDCDGDFCVDTNLGGFNLVSRHRYFERRCQIYEVFKELFTADCVVITLGLIEAWLDREKGVYIQEAPIGKIFAKQAQRFAFEALSYEQCRDYIQRSVDIVRDVNKHAKILITTSPVPLSRTFTTDDVITANSHSKSVLRAVAGDIAAANVAMDYFPSYESVSGTKNWQIWSYDLLHVSDAFVGKVVSRLTDIYCPGIQQSRKKYLDFYMASKGDNFNEALELGEQLAEDSSPEYLERLSQVLERKGEVDAAVNEFKKAVDKAPAEPRLRFRFSKLLAQSGRIQDALSEARYCVAVDPTNLLYRRHLATLYAGDRNYIDALGQRVLAALYRRQSKTQNVTLKRLLQTVCRQGVTTHKS